MVTCSFCKKEIKNDEKIIKIGKDIDHKLCTDNFWENFESSRRFNKIQNEF